MRKEGIHPEYFEEAKVFCNGEEVLTVSGAKVGSISFAVIVPVAQKSYGVDGWGSPHPYLLVPCAAREHTHSSTLQPLATMCYKPPILSEWPPLCCRRATT